MTNVIETDENTVVETATKITTSDGAGNSYVITGTGLSWDDMDGGPVGNITGVEHKTNGSTLFKIAGSTFWDDSSNVYDEGYTYNASIGTLYGMTAEVAWWLRGNDTVNGSSGNDKLRGYDGNDTVKGNDGNIMYLGIVEMTSSTAMMGPII